MEGVRLSAGKKPTQWKSMPMLWMHVHNISRTTTATITAVAFTEIRVGTYSMAL